MALDERDYYSWYNPKEFRRQRFQTSDTEQLPRKSKIGWAKISMAIAAITLTALSYSKITSTVKTPVQQENFKRIEKQKTVTFQREATTIKLDTPQQSFKKILVKGKSSADCTDKSKVLDNKAIKCMNDHYEMVLVSGN